MRLRNESSNAAVFREAYGLQPRASGIDRSGRWDRLPRISAASLKEKFYEQHDYLEEQCKA
jgi:hypothetical protein